ncbi:Yip1-like protein [Dysgonomonas alginatilytica]|uniref:Yip1-like protein n=1 Tax=Dysgonomonas alginatilytica TaxID=1605892 RepID=A0A2V3PU80_9BACT|nr:YIP1 family protein [Dysgonomonas alginatilytica]PXV69183.1 Yip1-like protein [Dysgonomonas alginatilytica]
MKNKETLSLLINPFVRIAGSKALVIGLVVFVISILVAYCGNMIFDGLVHSSFSTKISLNLAFLLPSVALAIFIVALYIAGRVLTTSSIRFIDVAGTITLSHAPLLLMSLIALIPGVYTGSTKIIQGLFIKNFGEVNGVEWALFFLFLFVSIVASIWFIVLAYKAFSISCNVKGTKSILGFIVALLLSETITTIVVYQIMKHSFGSGFPILE